MNYKNIYCGNCGKKGHIYRNCYKPIISLGIICVKYDNENINDIIKNCKKRGKIFNRYTISDILSNKSMINLIKSKIKFLMVCRKHSLGYIELIRGNYNFENDNDIIYVKKMFKLMTKKEIDIIKERDFDKLWNDLWVLENRSNLHKREYIQSKIKFEKLIVGIHNINLDTFINSGSKWYEPEWEFPKGRRNIKESDINCAIREFEEETNFKTEEYQVLDLNPISEIFMGNNGINYKHTYFFAQSLTNNLPNINDDNMFQHIEISDIKWLSFDEALMKIRDYNIERKDILNKIFNLIYYYLYHHITDNKLK
jgi:8-oxo-dGTP pyrophosphatase MutT (NUDIX family)